MNLCFFLNVHLLLVSYTLPTFVTCHRLFLQLIYPETPFRLKSTCRPLTEAATA